MGRIPDDYVPVHQRVETFRAENPLARIITALISMEPVTVRAEVYIGDNLVATGHATENGGTGNRTRQGAVEMSETAAVGRALAFAGCLVKGGIASREEMEKANLVLEDGGAIATNGGSQSNGETIEVQMGKWLRKELKLTKQTFDMFSDKCKAINRGWVATAAKAHEEGIATCEELFLFLSGLKEATV